MPATKILGIILLVCLLYYAYRQSILNFTEIKVNGEVFKTHSSLGNNEKAGQIMHDINENVIKFLRYLIKKGEDKKASVRRLLKRYNWDHMVENSPYNIEGTTSYMQDKGRVFSMCLRNRDGVFIPFNELMFVTLHELSHLMTEYIDNHDIEFWACFKYLLQNALECGVYKYVDYQRYPLNYCGLTIRHNPLDFKFDFIVS